MIKHSSSTLRPESLRENNPAFNAPFNARLGEDENENKADGGLRR